MNWTERQIRFIIDDLIEENPLACRALFRISAIQFTDKVGTMSVSISSSPVLRISLDFCRKHLENENDVKAVLLHEFLHVLLLHTEKYVCNSPLLNICLDAIINAIIYRNQGMEYADFFARFYPWEKMSFLLRPQCSEKPLEKEWMDIHKRIYEGKYCADDLFELLDYLRSKMNISGIEQVVLLGNHHENETASEEAAEILDSILKKMNGVKIWNKLPVPSTGSEINKEQIKIEKYLQHKWDEATVKTLKKCLLKDVKKKRKLVDEELKIPVLSGNDKRSLSRYVWSGIMPFSNFTSLNYLPCYGEKVHVYLDVSGSMKKEINQLVSLLFHFRKTIKRPIWVFSDDVKEAVFIGDRLEFDTSFGTQIEPVFSHMWQNKITRAMIVTDGYVEAINDEMLDGIDRSKIQVLLSAEGNPDQFEKNNITYTRLEPLNKKGA